MRTETKHTPERVMALSECSGMLRVIATAMVREHGAYYATVDGKHTKIVAEVRP